MLFFILLFAVCAGKIAHALGQEAIIGFTGAPGALRLTGRNINSGVVLLDTEDWPGVLRAASDLAGDFGRVTGSKFTTHLLNETLPSYGASKGDRAVIIAGTIGKSRLIDSLAQNGKIDVSHTKGKWEAFQTELVQHPMPGVSEALVISGSDKRGSIYGLYDISEQIGISPWHWFADVPAAKHPEVFALNKRKIQDSPAVKYRGIFINDEAPGLTNWINANYPPGEYGPGYNADFYSHVFELLLRMRANYLWPAEWDSMFYLDDPRSPRIADEYGIIIGTSHTEPMMRWTKEQSLLLDGAWNWDTNRENITAFFKEGALRSKPYESVYTVGMRGLGDTASPTITATSLGDIVATQQQILSSVFNESSSAIPQVWCLYKEVGQYFHQGLRVPDDITLLWADDNWGNIQRLPVGNETDRQAGAGVYYHFDYVGGPRSYKWINTISLQKTWEQMQLAYARDAKEVWLVNIGDLKGLELPLNHFLDLAYDPTRWSSPESTSEWLQVWATREFGSSVAEEVADIMSRYGMYAARRKYELMDTSIYSLINYDEADYVLRQWELLVHDAESVYNKLPRTTRPAFFELVLHPCSAGYTVMDIYITAAKNNLYAGQRRTSTNALASKALTLFNEDHALTRQYHTLLGGKWNHIMDQTHLGYNYWQQPMRNTLPPLAYTQIIEESLGGPMGVSITGSNASVPGDDQWHDLSSNKLTLPPIDPYCQDSRWIEIYSRGPESFNFAVSSSQPWVTVSPSSGSITPGELSSDKRLKLSVDWDRAPVGSTIVLFNITIGSGDYGNAGMPTVELPVNKRFVPASFHGFVESDGTVSIEAEHATRNTSNPDTYYAVIPSYGRTLSGVTLLPQLAATQQPPSSPRLEYDLYFFSNVSTVDVTVYLGPSLNTDPSRPLTYGISFNDQEPQLVQYVPSTPLGTLPSSWDATVSNSVWVSSSKLQVSGGENTLKLWAIEPGVVFQKIVVNLGGVRKSYLGPPESMIV